jgi:hypothetical protein
MPNETTKVKVQGLTTAQKKIATSAVKTRVNDLIRLVRKSAQAQERVLLENLTHYEYRASDRMLRKLLPELKSAKASAAILAKAREIAKLEEKIHATTSAANIRVNALNDEIRDIHNRRIEQIRPWKDAIDPKREVLNTLIVEANSVTQDHNTEIDAAADAVVAELNHQRDETILELAFTDQSKAMQAFRDKLLTLDDVRAMAGKASTQLGLAKAKEEFRPLLSDPAG